MIGSSIDFSKDGNTYNSFEKYGLYISKREFGKQERKTMTFESGLHDGTVDLTDYYSDKKLYNNFEIKVELSKHVRNRKHVSLLISEILKDIHGRVMDVKFSNDVNVYHGMVIVDSYTQEGKNVTISIVINADPLEVTV